MDSLKRTTLKTLSWQLIGFFTLALISYEHTGSIEGSASLAGTSMLSGLVLYFLHEKFWQKINWGKLATKKGGL